MRELGPKLSLLKDSIGYLIPSFPTKNQPVITRFRVLWSRVNKVWGLGSRVEGLRVLFLALNPTP